MNTTMHDPQTCDTDTMNTPARRDGSKETATQAVSRSTTEVIADLRKFATAQPGGSCAA